MTGNASFVVILNNGKRYTLHQQMKSLEVKYVTGEIGKNPVARQRKN
jgi:hypothetical protein